jgi:hypothetical protein
MAGWQFRCVCCGELREAPMARPEGTVYLRCVATREWAWYEPAAFITVTGGSPALGNGGSRERAPKARGRSSAAATARGTGKRRARAATRAAAGRKGAKRGRKRR